MNISNNFFSQGFGLVMIDLWESSPYGEFSEKHHQWLDNLSQNLNRLKFDSIINSCYNSKIDYNDPSIYNTLHKYSWHNFDQDIMLELVSQCFNHVMSKKILNSLPNYNIFALHSLESFNKHRKDLVPNVKNWLVVGCHWQDCTHERPLSLTTLCSQTDLNIFGAPWGFLKNNEMSTTSLDFENDKKIIWTHAFGNFYHAKLK